MNHSLSLWLGITFVVIGATNVWLILQASARVRDAKASSGLIAAHRIGGYIFIALFCVMGYFMVARLDDVGGVPPGTMIHLTLAMVLSPLLFVKVLVARYYKSHYSVLMPIGLVIFVLSFVLIGITAGPSFAHQVRMQTVSLAAIDLPPAAIDISKAAATMEKRCSKCHALDRIAGARKDARGWLATVNRMSALPDSGISKEDSRIIVTYVASQMAPKGPQAAANLEVARALVDQRCGRCHGLDRVYKSVETPEEWRATVARMVGYASGGSGALQPGEDRQIVAYLSATQTPDTVDQRKDRAAAASQTAAADQPPIEHDSKVIGFISFVCVGALTLIIRRPAKTPLAALVQDPPPVASGPLMLRLASITPQGSDAKTLRFILPKGRKLDARPGQFLTFSLLFDGNKVVRSYSICSSTARSGYVEITPKRVTQGCVSVFLNDRATVGMTVEASGAFGQFYFDESKHQNVVLIAAGSGITPMMAMLRYIDDLCLGTTVTLLYCVRTVNDILFHSELDQLQARLKNFRYHVLLSKPHTEWTGPRGHISREFVVNTVKEIGLQDFFICGPPSFMSASRAILIDLGVEPQRIRQESFGSSTTKNIQTSGIVEFARSGKTCTVRSGQTILEAAEEQGIGIPSSCRQGQCGTCKTRLLAGKVKMEIQEGLDPDSKAQGFVLLCVGYPDGDIKLDA